MPYVKGGNAAALPKFSDMLTLFQSGWADYAHPLALPHQKNPWLRPCIILYYFLFYLLDNLNAPFFGLHCDRITGAL